MLRQLLPLANYFVGRPHVVDLLTFFPFDFDQAVNSVEGNAAVIANNPSTAIGVRQAGNDPRLPAFHDFRGIDVEDAIVVRLAIFREGLMNICIGFKAGRL